MTRDASVPDQYEPDPVIDPLSDDRAVSWSFATTLVWIASRNVDAVAACLKQNMLASLLYNDEDDQLPYDEAMSELRARLYERKLTATAATDVGAGQVEIPYYEWGDSILTLVEVRGTDVLRYDGNMGRSAYLNPRFARSEVLTLWPRIDPAPARRVVTMRSTSGSAMHVELIQKQLTLRQEFWKKSIGWPNDDSSYVFLARAVHAMGKSMFGADWTGDEPCRDLMKALPVIPERSGWRASLAHDLLVKHHPEFNRQPRKPMQHSFEFTGKEWMTAVMIVKKHNEDQMPGLRRFSEVRDRIIQLAEASLLITAIREKAGVEPTPIPRRWWNSERIRDRFDLCQLRPDDPYGLGIGSDPYQWIFVTRESLMSCAPEAEHRPPSADTQLVTAPLRSEDRAKVRGRRPGQGSYTALDAPLILEMKRLLAEGLAASAEEAARQVAARAHGGGTVESKAERLARRFRKEGT